MRGGAWSLVTVAGNNAPPHRGGRASERAGARGGRARLAGGESGRRSGRRRHRRRHRDCSRGDCYLPTGTNTQQPLLPPREPLPELPARTPGDRCDRPGPGPTRECGGRRGSGSGGREAGGTALAGHPKRPGWRARGTRLFTPVPQARPSLGESGNHPPTLYPNSGAGGNPPPHFSENFLSWGPPRSLSHSYPKSPRIGCAPGPLKLLSSNSLNWGSWEPLLLPP